MFYRIMYSCIQAWRYRKLLANYATDFNLQIASVVDLSPEILFKNGIKGLIIDFDGVLAAYAMNQPVVEAASWLRLCCDVFSPGRIFIFSNKPTLIRKQYFTENFKGINFIIAKHKKPFPNSILHILQDTKLLPEELLMLDDRIGTGILAAAISNVSACLITKPYIDYTANPIRERLYILVRRFEQWLFS